MNNKGQGAIIAMSIGAILAVVILSVIFSTLSEQTTDGPLVTNDIFTGENGTCTRVSTNCYTPGTLVVGNATAGSEEGIAGNFTECGDSQQVLFGAFGQIVACPGCDGGASALNATYTSRSCGFITSGTTRTLINLLPVLLALAILIFIVGFITLRK